MADDDDILRANAAYYRAFATADFTAMTRIWAKEQVSFASFHGCPSFATGIL
jgi:SnoaL-like domain